MPLAASLAVLMLLGAACGSSTSSTSSLPSPAVSQAAGSSGGASPVPSPSATSGPSVLVQDSQGWKFRLSVSAPKLVVEVDVITATDLPPQKLVAPPGQDYITFVLRIVNATTDRPATFSMPGTTLNGEPLTLEVPVADKDSFGTQAVVCNPVCEFYPTELDTQSVVTRASAAAIPIGGRVDVALYFLLPVPSTAPVGDSTVHWRWPEGQDTSVPIVAN
jgi:hypothetical protein